MIATMIGMVVLAVFKWPQICASGLRTTSEGLSLTIPYTSACGWSSMAVEWADVAAIHTKEVVETRKIWIPHLHHHAIQKWKVKRNAIAITLHPEPSHRVDHSANHPA